MKNANELMIIFNTIQKLKSTFTHATRLYNGTTKFHLIKNHPAYKKAPGSFVYFTRKLVLGPTTIAV
jgi:hypothetical protein